MHKKTDIYLSSHITYKSYVKNYSVMVQFSLDMTSTFDYILFLKLETILLINLFLINSDK